MARLSEKMAVPLVMARGATRDGLLCFLLVVVAAAARWADPTDVTRRSRLKSSRTC
jgi:hypothetical protein